MKKNNHSADAAKQQECVAAGLEEALEEALKRKLEDVVTCLHEQGNTKSRLYEDVITLMDRVLFKIALQRSNNVKSNAASFLGINRNTFQKRLLRLGLDDIKK
ncbi:MAG: helix-turn-helix domain-containing protein [Smithellaceae bacterium]|nr:helix-turn-helix domain-containing protein [Smithellaceae bacterium]